MDAEIILPFPEVVFALDLETLHKPGAVRLDGYPRLVYAPIQHGPEIRTEDNGTTVSEIVTAFAETPDPVALAARFGTTPNHIAEAVRYAVECGAAAAIHPEG